MRLKRHIKISIGALLRLRNLYNRVGVHAPPSLAIQHQREGGGPKILFTVPDRTSLCEKDIDRCRWKSQLGFGHQWERDFYN